MEEKSSGLRTSTRPTAIRIVHLTGYACERALTYSSLLTPT
jgi:hypothetical protein